MSTVLAGGAPVAPMLIMQVEQTRRTGVAAALVLTLSGSLFAQDDSIIGDITSSDGNTGTPTAAAANQDAAGVERRLDDVAGAAGSWEVTPSGSFSYAVPIEIPQGRGGVQPSLSFVYDSHMPNGLMGVGWTLRGIPAIERVQFARGIRFDGGDQFAFNENGWGTPVAGSARLVEVGTNVYHTAVESFREFRVFGDCDGGTCYWEMKDGSGLTYRFGGMEQAALAEREAGMGVQRGVQAWALTSVEDLHGNGYRIFYDKDEWMMYPTRMVLNCPEPDPEFAGWTPQPPPPGEQPLTPPSLPDLPQFPLNIAVDPNAASIGIRIAPFLPPLITIGITDRPSFVPFDPTQGPCPSFRPEREIVFTYDHHRGDRPMAPAQYHRRLRSIAVNSAGEEISHYALGYEYSQTALSQLRTIGRRAPGHAQPVTELRFDWLDPQPSYGGLDHSPASGVGNTIESHVGDINGDGFDDLVRVDAFDTLRVDYQLGGLGGLGAVQTIVREGEDFPAENGRVRSYHQWKSILADVDADGLDDLTLWFAGHERAFVMVAPGQVSGSFAPFGYYGHSEELMGFGASQHDLEPYTFRMLTGDFNGDQITDLVLFNAFTTGSAYMAGAGPPDRDANPGARRGLQAPVARIGGDTSPGYKYEPLVADFNADGIADVLHTYEIADGAVATFYAYGSHTGLQGATTIAWGELNPAPPLPPDVAGWITPSFQAIAGDINGDRAADLTLAYSGPISEDNRGANPYSRDVRTLFGHSDTKLVDWRTQVADVMPDDPEGISFEFNYLAFWQHHGGDFNCDGLADLLAYYGGHDGQAVRVRQGQGDGTYGEAESRAGLGSAPDPAHTADGGRYTHKWQSRIADVNSDGCDDFIRYYAGQHGAYVDVAVGTADGLSDWYVSELSSAVAIAETGRGRRAASVTLLTPDIDGNGTLDFVLSTYGDVFVAFGDDGDGARLRRVENGIGGSVWVQYESSSQLDGAVVVRGGLCESGSAADPSCSVSMREPRPLATFVRTHNGRGLLESRRYVYEDGRYYPGPLTSALSAMKRPHSSRPRLCRCHANRRAYRCHREDLLSARLAASAQRRAHRATR